MSPTHPKSSLQQLQTTSRMNDAFSTQDILLENYKQQALLMEKYKQQLALLDNYKKQALLQRFYDAKQMEQSMDRNLSSSSSSSELNGELNGINGSLDSPVDQYEIFKQQQQQQQDSINQTSLPQPPPMRKLSSGSGSKEVQLAEHFKQMTMQDTMQRRTLAMQESIRQTLAAGSGPADLNNNNNNNNNKLADPRWSGVKQYRGLDDRNDMSRRDNGIFFFFFFAFFISFVLLNMAF